MTTVLTITLIGAVASFSSAFAQEHDHADHESHSEHEDASHNEHEDDHGGHEGHDDHTEVEGEHDDHEGHDDHAEGDDEHGDHEGHDDHAEGVALSSDTIAELGIEVLSAAPGQLNINVTLSGEVRLNGDRLAHVVPRLPGIVTEVRKSLGDAVLQGEVMAVLESRELADLKAAYLAGKERLALAEATHAREARLFERNVSAENDLLQAKRDLAEFRIEYQAAAQRLYALGFVDADFDSLTVETGASMTRYEVRAPIDGVIISKHVTLGEAVADDADVFTVADLGTVWVDLSVYPRDLSKVKAGQRVVVRSSDGIPEQVGSVTYVGPTIGEDTRTALARVVLDNHEGRWRPGLFVTGQVVIESQQAAVLVPLSAIQTIDGESQIFVKRGDAFELSVVKLGLSDEDSVEVRAGLAVGDRYVSQGAFHLKAEREKEAFAHSGHAH